jgi:hypothetical protein
MTHFITKYTNDQTNTEHMLRIHTTIAWVWDESASSDALQNGSAKKLSLPFTLRFVLSLIQNSPELSMFEINLQSARQRMCIWDWVRMDRTYFFFLTIACITNYN